MNVDAATHVAMNEKGFSFLIRDEDGRFLAAKNSRLPGNFTPKITKALAIKEVLSWLESRNWRRLVIQSDCQPVILALQNPNYEDLMPFGGKY